MLPFRRSQKRHMLLHPFLEGLARWPSRCFYKTHCWLANAKT